MITPIPQGQDTVSQMKSYLQQSGYTPPAPTTSTGSGDWYDSVVQNRQQTQNQSMGGFGEVAHSVGDTFNQHADNVEKILSSKDNGASKTLQVFGQGAGAVNDTAGDIIKSVVKPEVLKAAGDALHPLIEAAKNSPAGQKIINWWADLEQSHPETAKNLEATGQIASLLSNAVGVGVAKEGAVAGTKAALSATEKAIAPATEAAKGAVQSVKDTAGGVKDAVTGSKNSFQDVYNTHAQISKTLSNALDRNTITQGKNTISPIDTIAGYEATPKVITKTGGGHGLDFTDVKAESEAKSKALTKTIDAKAEAITETVPKKEVLQSALDAAAKDKGLVRTASVPGVQHNITQIFKDYGIEGEHITAPQLNEFRKGANQASQAYYKAQETAGVGGTIPKEVSDRAEAFATLGDTFREQLAKLDSTIKPALQEQATHIKAGQYAHTAHLSSIGVSGAARSAIDVGAAGAGAALGSMAGPAGAAIGAGAGVGLSEKAQQFLLKRTYEGAIKTTTPSIAK